MDEIRNVPVNAIDPESTVNVRREGVEDNVERLTRSIQTHGFWPDQPVTLRPHPDSDSEYQYEYVVGQCRLAAARGLGLQSIPALVLDLSDDEALRRSWTENEARGDLLPSEKAYWTESLYNKFSTEGSPHAEALQRTAEWLGVTEQTVRNYWPLAFLPEAAKDMINQGRINQEEGRVIAANTDGGEEGMLERARWLAQSGAEKRAAAREALREALPTASVPELERLKEQNFSARQRTVTYEIPEALYDRLVEYGQESGIRDVPTIVSNIIAKALGG